MSKARIQAEIDKGWTEAKIRAYAQDGGDPPEPVKRLHVLSTIVLSEPEATSTAGNDAAWQDATKCASPAIASQAIEEMLKVAQRESDGAQHLRNEWARVCREAALFFVQSAARISGIGFPGELAIIADAPMSNATHEEVHRAAAPPKDPSTGNGPAATFQDAREGYPAPRVETLTAAPQKSQEGPSVVVPERKPIALRSGLVLVKRGSPEHKVLFSNPKGTWIVQTITATGELGPDTAGNEGAWFADTWEEGPAYVPPKQTTIQGTGPLPGQAAPSEPKKTMTGTDWTPDDAYIEERVKALGERMATDEKSVMIDAQLVRSLIARFRGEFPAKEFTNIGLSFHHYAVKQLKG